MKCFFRSIGLMFIKQVKLLMIDQNPIFREWVGLIFIILLYETCFLMLGGKEVVIGIVDFFVIEDTEERAYCSDIG